MVQRMRFEDFKERLEKGTLSPDEARHYLELDPSTAKVRVRIKPDALLDGVPPDYDVDAAVHALHRRLVETKPAALKAPNAATVVAEGDSWFELPNWLLIGVFIPNAIVQILDKNKKLKIKSVAKWGDTLDQMLGRKDYVKAIKKHKPQWFILSAGGNDIADALESGQFLHPYSATRPVGECITDAGRALLERISRQYDELIREVRTHSKTMRILCYGYDYAQPEVGVGKHIGRHLRALQYPPASWDAVVEVVINELGAAIERAASSHAGVQFLDVRNTVIESPWWDDMHPETQGFEILAERFASILVPKAAAAKATRKRVQKPRKAARRKSGRTKVAARKKVVVRKQDSTKRKLARGKGRKRA